MYSYLQYLSRRPACAPPHQLTSGGGCWLVLTQCTTTGRRFGRENLNWENVATCSFSGQACGTFSCLRSQCTVDSAASGLVVLGARRSSGSGNPEDRASKLHSSVTSASVLASSFLCWLSSSLDFWQWWAVMGYHREAEVELTLSSPTCSWSWHLTTTEASKRKHHSSGWGQWYV